MKISGRVVGADAVVRRLTATAPKELEDRVRVGIQFLGGALLRRAVTVYLSGRALHKRSGRGQRSVKMRTGESSGTFWADVGSELLYLRAWERGFHTPSYRIFPKRGKALYWPGARFPVRSVMHRAATHAARPWLAPAAHDLRPETKRILAQATHGL